MGTRAFYLSIPILLAAQLGADYAIAGEITPVSISNVQVDWSQGEGTNTTSGGIYYAGPITMTGNFAGGNQQAIVWCDDLNNVVYIGSSDQYYSTDTKLANAYLSPLSIKVDHLIAGLTYEGTKLAESNALTPTTGAEYQMAIWELEYHGLQDTDSSLQAGVNGLLGNAKIDYGQMLAANYTYSELESPGCNQQPGTITYTNGCQTQGEIYVHQRTQVPEPDSLALLGGGLLGMAFWGRGRRLLRRTV